MFLQLNQVIANGKYRVVALLGQGASADVYLVTHLGMGTQRAAKVLKVGEHGVGSTEFADFTQRFQQEAQLGDTVRSPHLLEVYDFEAGDPLILIMEYALGGSLASRLFQAKQTNEPVPIDEAVGIALDVAEGLAVIHDNDVVHRDVKPSNILFGRDGHAKIADLGLAQTTHNLSNRSLLSQPLPHPGTPAYMSPEQANEREYLPPASDVYALGLVLFETLTGRVYKNQRRGTRVSALRPDVPPKLDDLVARMLDPNPEHRPFNGAELAEALRAIEIAPRWIPKRAIPAPPPPPRPGIEPAPPAAEPPPTREAAPPPAPPPAAGPAPAPLAPAKPGASSTEPRPPPPAPKAASTVAGVAAAEKLASQKEKAPEPSSATRDAPRPPQRPGELGSAGTPPKPPTGPPRPNAPPAQAPAKTSVPATSVGTTREPPPPKPAPATTEPPPAVGPTDAPAPVSPATKAAAATGGVAGAEKLASEKDKSSQAGHGPSSHVAPQPAKPEALRPQTPGTASVPAASAGQVSSAAASPAPAKPIPQQPASAPTDAAPKQALSVESGAEGGGRGPRSVSENTPQRRTQGKYNVLPLLLVVAALAYGLWYLVVPHGVSSTIPPPTTAPARQPTAAPAAAAPASRAPTAAPAVAATPAPAARAPTPVAGGRVPAAVAAAAMPTVSVPSGTVGLEGQLWRLASYANVSGVLTDLPSNIRIAAEFNAGKITGNGGCNNYSGAYSVNGDQIVISQVAATMKACAQPIMVLEQAYFKSLQAVASFHIADDFLELVNNTGALVLRYKISRPVTLVNIRWVATGYNNGKNAVVSVAAGTEITAIFGTDGKLTGSGGCNSYTAGYQTTDTNIQIEPAASTKNSCVQAVMQQEQAYLVALPNSSTYTIRENTLELRDSTGALMATYRVFQ